MKKEDLTAWKILIFFRKEDYNERTKKIWQKIFLECQKKLNCQETKKFFTENNFLNLSDYDFEVGAIKTQRLILENYNFYVEIIEKRISQKINFIEKLIQKRKSCYKKEEINTKIAKLIDAIKMEQLILMTLREELKIMLTKIEILKIKEKN